MAEPLTIVILFDHATMTGGQSKVAFESAAGLKRAGHRPIVFAAAGPVSPELAALDIETVCLDQLDLVANPSKIAAAVQGIWNLKAARALSELLATLPKSSTIVHVHGWAKALSPSIAIPIRRSGLPAISTMHEYFQFCPNGGFYNYQRHHQCKLKPLSAACWATNCDSRSYTRKLWRNLRLTIAKHGMRLPHVFSHYVVLSEFQQAIVAPLLPPSAILLRIDNPVAASNLGPRPHPANGEIIFVGRLSPEKGVFVYAEAARRLGLRPVFVGDGPLAAEIGARYPESRLLGWQTADGVRAAMRAAHALVFPSLWYEGQPLTVLEAKGLGVPIIVSDACAARDEVEDGVTGLWFKSQDVDDLVRAMAALQDDERAAAMSRAAHAAFWRRPPTLERHVARLLGVYGEMLARHRLAKAPSRRPAGRAEGWAAALSRLQFRRSAH